MSRWVFIDSSAILRTIFNEGPHETVDSALVGTPVISCVTEVEVPAAINRHRRDGVLDYLGAEECLRSAADLLSRVTSLELSAGVKREAVELTRAHPLRSLDAIQVASAVVAARTSRRRGNTLTFMTADRRQADAARAIFGDGKTILLDPL